MLSKLNRSFKKKTTTLVFVTTLLASLAIGNFAMAAAPTMTEYPTGTGTTPQEMTTDGSGNVWFTDPGKASVGEVSPSGTVTEYKLSYGTCSFNPQGIAYGADGNLYITSNAFCGPFSFFVNIVSFSPTTDTVLAVYPVPTIFPYVYGITAGPDGNIWFTEQDSGKVGVLNLSTKVITEYLPSGTPALNQITAGADGNLWVADSGNNSLDKVTTAGTITEYPLTGTTSPYGVTAGPDGNVWFTTQSLTNPVVGNINPSTAAITTYSLPGTVAGVAHPFDITTGPDKNLWFTDDGPDYNGAIGTVTTAGTISEYATPTTGSNPQGIVDPSGIWFAESTTSKVGFISVAAPSGGLGAGSGTTTATSTSTRATSTTAQTSNTPGVPNTGFGSPVSASVSLVSAIISLPVALILFFYALVRFRRLPVASSK